MCYLPYATSLRLSDLGYTNKSQSNLGITFNDLQSYVEGLKRAIATPSEEFAKLGVKDGDRYLQLNSNVLQIENELYAPIRPKRVTKSGETPSDALCAAVSNTLKFARWTSTHSRLSAWMRFRRVSWTCSWCGACWPMRQR